MGYMLAQAETMRLKADYDVGIQITKEECEETINYCEKFIDTVKKTIPKL